MTQPKWPWFQRSFDFDFPVEKAPDILERLRGTPIRVEISVNGLPQEALQFRESDGTWSIQENIGHLADLEPLWYGRYEDILAGCDVMREADLTNRSTFDANHNSQAIESILAEFAALRKRQVDLLESLDLRQFSQSALHPRLNQPMRIVDLCLFVVEHDDYHLARIEWLKRQIPPEQTN